MSVDAQALPENAGSDEARPLTMEPECVRLSDLQDRLGTRRFHVLLMAACMLTQMVPASIVGPVPYVLDAIADNYEVDNASASMMASGPIFGGIAGAISCGWLCDLVGRRAVIVLCLMGATALTVLQYVAGQASSFAPLIAVRVALGLPFGGLSTLVVPYLVEFFPTDTRGMAVAALNLGWPIGSLYCLLVVRVLGAPLWRVCLSAPLVPGLFLLMWAPFLPESPHWLFLLGRETDGQRAVDMMYKSPVIWGQAWECERMPRVFIPARGADFDTPWNLLPELLSSGIRSTTFLSCLIYIFTAATSYAFWVWGPQILQAATGKASIPLIIFTIYEASGAAANIGVMMTIDNFGRKPLLILGNIVGLVVVSGLLLHPNLLVAAILWVVMGAMQSLLWTSTSVYVGEVFPTALRGTGNGLAQMFGRLASGFWPIVVGALVSNSLPFTLLAIAAPLVFGLAAACCMQETAGCALCDVKQSAD